MAGLRVAAKFAGMHSAAKAAEDKEAEKLRNVPLAALPTGPAVIDAVLSMTTDLSLATSLRQLLCSTLRISHRLTTALHAAIFIVGEDDGSMLYVAYPQDEHGNTIESDLDTSRLAEVGPGIVGHVITSGETVMVSNASDDLRFDPSVDRAPGYVVNSLMCAPVIGAQGKPIAAVQLCNKVRDRRQQVRVPEAFEKMDLRVLGILCAVLGPSLDRQLILDREF